MIQSLFFLILLVISTDLAWFAPVPVKEQHQKDQHQVANQLISSPGATSSYSPGGQYIMLTFDDGPHSTLTPRLLDILREKKVRVTFFVLGFKALDNPDIVKRMLADGHEVASHGWSHTALSKISRDQILPQLEQTGRVIEELTKKKPAFYRPPFGGTNAKLNEMISGAAPGGAQMKVVLWSIDSQDWDMTDPTAIAKGVVDRAKPGDVVLCHDVLPQMIDAVPQVSYLSSPRCCTY